MTLFITGGAGFIGTALIDYLLANTQYHIINIDVLTYAANIKRALQFDQNERYILERADIRNKSALECLFSKYQPKGLIHLAAESHVDRSIENAHNFIHTNIIGTYNLLETALSYRDRYKVEDFRFVHVSTDEVYGSCQTELFTEQDSYLPNSPYSASKASADHLTRAWHQTYELPTICTHSSNNYGPYQFPEKLIPLTICNALYNRTITIYGNGLHIRDWLYVYDHASALLQVLQKGTPGESYNIGSSNEWTNWALVTHICDRLDYKLNDQLQPRRNLIQFAEDRPGHDYRYALDASKIRDQLDWHPQGTFYANLDNTIDWYLRNQDWLKARYYQT